MVAETAEKRNAISRSIAAGLGSKMPNRGKLFLCYAEDRICSEMPTPWRHTDDEKTSNPARALHLEFSLPVSRHFSIPGTEAVKVRSLETKLMEAYRLYQLHILSRGSGRSCGDVRPENSHTRRCLHPDGFLPRTRGYQGPILRVAGPLYRRMDEERWRGAPACIALCGSRHKITLSWPQNDIMT